MEYNTIESVCQDLIIVLPHLSGLLKHQELNGIVFLHPRAIRSDQEKRLLLEAYGFSPTLLCPRDSQGLVRTKDKGQSYQSWTERGPWSSKPTFSTSRPPFLRELLRRGPASVVIVVVTVLMVVAEAAVVVGKALRPDRFSSCRSASRSLVSAFMLSKWYTWYVFLVCREAQAR